MYKKILIIILVATGELFSAQPIAQTTKEHPLDVVTTSKDVQRIITGYLSGHETVRAVSTIFSSGLHAPKGLLENMPTNELIASYAYSPNGQYIAIGYHAYKCCANYWGGADTVSADKYLDILDLQNNKLIRSVPIKFQDKIKDFLNWDKLININVQFSPDSKSVAAITAGNKIRIWDIATGAEKIYNLNVQKFCFAGPNTLFCVSQLRNKILLFNTQFNHSMYKYAFTPKHERIEWTRSEPTYLPSKKLVVAHLSGYKGHKWFSRLYMLNSEDQKLVKVIENVGLVEEIIYSPDEKYLVTVGRENLDFYNSETFEITKRIKKPDANTYFFNFSKNGKFLVFIKSCEAEEIGGCGRPHHSVNVMDIEKNRITRLNINTPCRYYHRDNPLWYSLFIDHEKISYISIDQYWRSLKVATLWDADRT